MGSVSIEYTNELIEANPAQTYASTSYLNYVSKAKDVGDMRDYKIESPRINKEKVHLA